ncbi:hypothetical protein D3C76_1306100 [compost metagenome]
MKRTPLASMNKLRLIRRPPDCCIPRQFLNDSDIKRQVGIEIIVLSKFCTFTVCSVMSTTSPSAPTCGISIQSPTRSMSLLVSCTPATNDSSVSL